MSSHKDHDHDNTPAARAACRRRHAVVNPALDAAYKKNIDKIVADTRVEEFDVAILRPIYTATTETHCELCGSFDYEDLYTGDQGYTACCNEPTCDGGSLTTWTWEEMSTDNKGTIETCCSARITFPNDMIRLTGRAF